MTRRPEEQLILCDIDGTLSDPTHRLHLVDGSDGRKDWLEFFAQCGSDGLHQDIANLLLSLGGRERIYVSGRPERCRAATRAWMEHHGVPPGELRMRKDGDFRADDLVKSELTRDLAPNDVWFVLDDRQRVVDMWRARGFRCLQVAAGAF